MTIKIKELNIKKDVIMKDKNTNEWGIATNTKLYGEMKLGFSKGIAKGTGEIEVTDISEKLQNKLYDVLGEIENELNGVSVNTDAYSWNSIVSGGVINASSKIETGGTTANFHNGETVLTSDEVGNIHIKGYVDFKDATIKQLEEVKAHETDQVNSYDEFEKALSELGKETMKTGKSIGETLASSYLKALQQINEEIDRKNK